MDISYFLKGLLMGLIFGVPAGAIGLLSIANTLKAGFIAGLFTGLGSSFADLLYAFVVIFGMGFISDFMTEWRTLLGIAGGIVILFMGILNLKGAGKKKEAKAGTASYLGNFSSSFAVAILNPATILSFFAAFAAFQIPGNLNLLDGASLIIGIFTGTCLWWIGISAGVSLFKEHLPSNLGKILDYVLSGLLLVLGLILLVRSFLY